MIDDQALAIVELGYRIRELAELTADIAEAVADLRRCPVVVIVVVRDGRETYEGEAEDVTGLPQDHVVHEQTQAPADIATNEKRDQRDRDADGNEGDSFAPAHSERDVLFPTHTAILQENGEGDKWKQD